MKTLILLVTLLAVALPQGAFAVPTLARMKAKINQNIVPSDGNLFRLGDQFTNKKVQVMKVTFEARRLGVTGGYMLGGVGTSSLQDVDGTAATIPSGALVKSAWLDVRNSLLVLLPNSIPSLCFQLQTECDLYTAQKFTAYQSGGATSFRQIMPINGNTVMLLTADRIVQSVVTGAALTGGTMNLFIEYFVP